MTLSIGAVLLIAKLAHACSCEPPPPPLASLERAGVVFVGEVVDIELRDTGRFGNMYYVNLRVSTAFKGVVSKEVTVITKTDDGATCGYVFEVGEEYLVYGDIENVNTYELGYPSVGICSRTKLIGVAGTEVDDLRRATAVSTRTWSGLKDWMLRQTQ